MPSRIQAVFYRARDGSEPVDDWIETLPTAHQVAIDNYIDRINELTTPKQPDLPFPGSSQVEGQLRELRCHYGRGTIAFSTGRVETPRPRASEKADASYQI